MKWGRGYLLAVTGSTWLLPVPNDAAFQFLESGCMRLTSQLLPCRASFQVVSTIWTECIEFECFSYGVYMAVTGQINLHECVTVALAYEF